MASVFRVKRGNADLFQAREVALKHFCFATLLFLGAALTSCAQDTTNNPTKTLFVARTGERLDSPHSGTYHFLELLQMRGNWIYPDVGYIDFAHGNYRELFVGAGRTLHNGKCLTLTEELYFVQATGPAAKSARYLWPWTLVQFRFTPKFTNETLYFPYLPLNNSARIQHVLERSKCEYTLTKSWQVGAGYGGYKFADSAWQHKPFLTTTLTTHVGAFELWLQKLAGGTQVQLRYAFLQSSR